MVFQTKCIKYKQNSNVELQYIMVLEHREKNR